MRKVLITGATGNVGIQVIESLRNLSLDLEIFAGLRDIDHDSEKLRKYGIKTLKFNFTDPETFSDALSRVDILFLLRPPQLSNVSEYFEPLINMASTCEIKHIVFLSVQGVDNSSIIPHYQIEKLIVESKIPYTFLRPAYFMQNFTTILRKDIIEKKLIFLPAGTAKFTLIDVRDVGAVAATIISDFEAHTNQSYELTSLEKLTFKEMAEKMSSILKITIRYRSPNLINFFITKRSEKLPFSLILVMIMLHFLPRFKKEPQISKWVYILTGREPISFEQFVIDNINIFAAGTANVK